MTQRKPAKKPKAQVREVFEIRPLRWTKQEPWDSAHDVVWTVETVLGELSIVGCGWHCFLSFKGDNRGTFSDSDAAKREAEKLYRQQLAKALRRVK